MPPDESWTIGRLLRWTTDYFRQHGSHSPRLDAEVLLAEARGCQRIDLYTAFDDEPGEEIRASFRQLVRRRAAGEPVAYLVGRREFYSLSFQVTSDVLIPRPETEFVVLALMDAVKQAGAGQQTIEIADVGTGSGVLAVCAAKHLANARVTAIDISPQALDVARRNAREHGVAERVQFVRSDLLQDLPPDQRFDYIVSNPPYVATSEMADLSAEVSKYEPPLALVAGPVGLEVIQRLVPQSAQRLRAGGWLITEISPMIEAAVRTLIETSGAYAPPATVKDLAGLARVITAQRLP